MASRRHGGLKRDMAILAKHPSRFADVRKREGSKQADDHKHAGHWRLASPAWRLDERTSQESR
ncbi:hypothetical protein [Bradyrhizobium sp. CSS354]|uniref:hypothetical protein n=1 Tax=Bradyrhizobium sp. CSS354 TaxID=2699172 RepID=UPI0023B1062F|nr:hypothetical protein [Bradyrhizobium sp. CSS354]